MALTITRIKAGKYNAVTEDRAFIVDHHARYAWSVDECVDAGEGMARLEPIPALTAGTMREALANLERHVTPVLTPDEQDTADHIDYLTNPTDDDGVDYDWAAPAALDALDVIYQAQHDAQAALTAMSEHLNDALAALVKDHRPQDMVEAILWCQDQRRVLRDLEDRITQAAATAPTIGQTGDLSDGRHYEVKRAANRKAWDHDAWKHDARAKITTEAKGRYEVTGNDLVDTTTGEVVTLGHALQTAMTALQEFHGSTAPRVGTMRQYDLDPGDYCQTTPGGWTVNITDPTTN